ncbi:MAG: hypothetical protein ACRDKF_08225 [Actinomycetota bacterium]
MSRFEASYEWLAIVAAINTVASIFYCPRVMAPAYFDDLRDYAMPRVLIGELTLDPTRVRRDRNGAAAASWSPR